MKKPWIVLVIAVVSVGALNLNHRYHHDHRFRYSVNERCEGIQAWWERLWAPMPIIEEETEEERQAQLDSLKEKLGQANSSITQEKQIHQMLQGVQEGLAGMTEGTAAPDKDYNPRDDDDAGHSYERETSE